LHKDFTNFPALQLPPQARTLGVRRVYPNLLPVLCHKASSDSLGACNTDKSHKKKFSHQICINEIQHNYGSYRIFYSYSIRSESLFGQTVTQKIHWIRI